MFILTRGFTGPVHGRLTPQLWAQGGKNVVAEGRGRGRQLGTW